MSEYDIKQVTRYVLVQEGGKDIAEFRRRDEAERVLKALSGVMTDRDAAYDAYWKARTPQEERDAMKAFERAEWAEESRKRNERVLADALKGEPGSIYGFDAWGKK